MTTYLKGLALACLLALQGCGAAPGLFIDETKAGYISITQTTAAAGSVTQPLQQAAVLRALQAQTQKQSSECKVVYSKDAKLSFQIQYQGGVCMIVLQGVVAPK